jgi:hypothetical protein
MVNKHIFLQTSRSYLLYRFILLLERIEIMLDERFKAEDHGLANRETSPTWFPYFQAPRKESRSQTKPIFFSPYFPARPRDAATGQQPAHGPLGSPPDQSGDVSIRLPPPAVLAPDDEAGTMRLAR